MIETDERYTTLINGETYSFEVWKMIRGEWRANAFTDNGDRFFTYAFGPNPEEAALKLVKKIESKKS